MTTTNKPGPKPSVFNGAFAELPKALIPLTKVQRWLIWRLELNEKQDGWTKVPYKALSPSIHASTNDPKTWASYKAALAAVEKADGLGFSLTNAKLAAADLDHCRDLNTGEIEAWAAAILEQARALGAYIEITVSGEGFRILGRATGGSVDRRWSIPGSHPKTGIELYRKPKGRYITVSGNMFCPCADELPNIDGLIDSLIAQFDAKAAPSPGDDDDEEFDLEDAIINGAPEGKRSNIFARVVWKLASNGQSPDEIEARLKKHPNGIARKYLNREGRLREEIDRSFGKWQLRQKKKPGLPAAKENIHSWDEPDISILDDRRGDLPEFPIDALCSQPLQDWVRRSAEGQATMIDHVIVPALGIASSLIGSARKAQASRSWLEPATCWTALVGFSGTGKTPGIKPTKNALVLLERGARSKVSEMKRVHDARAEKAKAVRKQWEADVKEAVANDSPVPPKPPSADDPGQFVAPRLYITDATIESIQGLLKARPQGLLMLTDELAGLLLNMCRYSNGTDRGFWLEAWNGGSYIVERKSRPPLCLDDLLVGVIGGIQPSKLAISFGEDEDGLYARFLFSWPTEAPYRELSDASDEADPEIVNALKRLADLGGDDPENLIRKAIPLSPEALAVFEQLRELVYLDAKLLEGRERDWWSKIPGHTLRLAGALALFAWAMTGGPEPQKIAAQYMDGAVRLVRDYFWPHARAAMRLIGVTEHHIKARRVLNWIKNMGREEISREEIRREALSQSLDADDTQALLDRLEQAGWLRRIAVKQEGAGRPPLRWEVNPQLWR